MAKEPMYYVVEEQSKGTKYTALAKLTPFKKGYFGYYEPGKTWYEVGETKEEALNNLKKSLPAGYDWVEWEKKE